MYAIEYISTNVLKVHSYNMDFYNSIKGDDYERLKDSVKYGGILFPIIVLPNLIILEGHQRVKAAKELGLDLVPVIIRDDIQDELSQLLIILSTITPSRNRGLQNKLEKFFYLDIKQQMRIKEVAKNRVCEIIGNSISDYQKYFKIYIHHLYDDARKYSNLGSKISATLKCDYQRCIDFIESWVPSCGCAALKAKADANAAARLEARKLGYLDKLKKRKE